MILGFRIPTWRLNHWLLQQWQKRRTFHIFIGFNALRIRRKYTGDKHRIKQTVLERFRWFRVEAAEFILFSARISTSNVAPCGTYVLHRFPRMSMTVSIPLTEGCRNYNFSDWIGCTWKRFKYLLRISRLFMSMMPQKPMLSTHSHTCILITCMLANTRGMLPLQTLSLICLLYVSTMKRLGPHDSPSSLTGHDAENIVSYWPVFTCPSWFATAFSYRAMWWLEIENWLALGDCVVCLSVRKLEMTNLVAEQDKHCLWKSHPWQRFSTCSCVFLHMELSRNGLKL